MAKIEIFSREVYIFEDSAQAKIGSNSTGTYAEHTYLLYTDDAGNKRILRGGAQDPTKSWVENPLWGSLHVIEGIYQEGQYDWDDPNDGKVHVTAPSPVASGSDADILSLWQTMMARGAAIDASGYDYGWPYPNSNTVVHELIRYAEQNTSQLLRDATNWQGDILPQRNGQNVDVPGWSSPLDGTQAYPDQSLLFQRMLGGNDEPTPPTMSGIVSDMLTAMARAGLAELNDPLVLDLDGDGVELSALASSHAYFDLQAENFANRAGWVAGGDGLLAIDANANGKIDDISELFGNATQTGFQELATLDSNADNKITAADAQWNSLRVWVDADADGKTDAGELKTLAQLGITEFGLTTTASNTDINGNTLVETSTFVMNGQTRTTGEVLLATDQTNTIYDGDLASLNWEAMTLPSLRGYGTVADLPIAMSLDATLLTMGQNLNTHASLGDFTTFTTDLRTFMFNWAGPARRSRATARAATRRMRKDFTPAFFNASCRAETSARLI